MSHKDENPLDPVPANPVPRDQSRQSQGQSDAGLSDAGLRQRQAHAILDENLGRLLRQAYVPARPSQEFRSRLTQVARAEVFRLRQVHTKAPSSARFPHRKRLVAALTAALILLAIGFVWSVYSGALTSGRSSAGNAHDSQAARAIVASGRVAASWDSGLTWSAFAVPREEETLRLGSGEELLLQTPPGASIRTSFQKLSSADAGSTGAGNIATDRAARSREFAARVAPQSKVQLSSRNDLHILLESGALNLHDLTGTLASIGREDRSPQENFTGATLSFRVERGQLQLTRQGAGHTLTSWPNRDAAEAQGGDSSSLVILTPNHDDLSRAKSFRLLPGGSARYEAGLLRGDLEAWEQPADQTATQPNADAWEAGGRATWEQESSVAPTAESAQPGHALLVSVTDALTGNPLQDVTLGLVPVLREREIRETHHRDSSSPLGQHVFVNPPAGEFSLVVYAKGYALWSGTAERFGPEDTRTINVPMSLGGSIRGYVVDQASGNPIMGAVVAPRDDIPAAGVSWDLLSAQQWLPISARTGPSGEFLLPHVSKGTHELHIAAPGYAPRLESNLVVGGDAAIDLPTLTLSPECVLEGRVLDANGAPDIGRRIVVTPFDAGAYLNNFALGVTDVDGVYSIGQLPAGMHFAILTPNSASSAPEVRPIRTFHGETTVLSFAQASNGTLVTGALLDAWGKPIADRNIALLDLGESEGSPTSRLRASSTSPAGHFRFAGVTPGTYAFMVVMQGNQVTTVETFTIEKEAERKLEMRVGAAEATGMILNAYDQSPVEEVVVHLYQMLPGKSKPRYVAEAVTDSDGRWTMAGLQAGRYYSIAYPGQAGSGTSGPLGFARGQVFELGGPGEPSAATDPTGSPGSNTPSVDFGSLELSAGINVRLLLRGTNGEPLPETSVRVICGDGTAALQTPYQITDSEGALMLFGMAHGTFSVRVDSPNIRVDEFNFRLVAGDSSPHEIILQ